MLKPQETIMQFSNLDKLRNLDTFRKPNEKRAKKPMKITKKKRKPNIAAAVKDKQDKRAAQIKYRCENHAISSLSYRISRECLFEKKLNGTNVNEIASPPEACDRIRRQNRRITCDSWIEDATGETIHL